MLAFILTMGAVTSVAAPGNTQTAPATFKELTALPRTLASVAYGPTAADREAARRAEARRQKICQRQSELDPRTFTTCEYSGAYAWVMKDKVKARKLQKRGLHPPGSETARDRKVLFWIANPSQYNLMRRESEAGKWYESPRAALWYRVNGRECSGTWNCNTGNRYYGGLQMDLQFQRTYNPAAYELWGTADNWPIGAQMLAADRAYEVRGLNPWPSSLAAEGLRPVP